MTYKLLKIRYSRHNLAITFYVIALFMLANGNLFSFILKPLHLSSWRQGLFAIGIYYIYIFRKTYVNTEIAKLIRLYGFFALIIICFAIVTFLFRYYSIVRIIFSFWLYFSGLPFLIFPHIYKVCKGEGGAKKFYNIFIYLGAFSTLGLCIDYILGGAITQFFFLINENLDDYSFEHIGRYYFLTESPTSFGLFYCFCLACVCYRLYYESSQRTKMVLFVLVLFFLFGGWLTGSRQILLAQIVELVIAGSFYIFHASDNKSFLVYFVVGSIFILPSLIQPLIEKNENLTERYDVNAVKEDKRSKVWLRGFKETCVELDVFFLGNGFGYTALNNLGEGEESGYHYENTYFARISETGIMGLIIFLTPFYYIFKDMTKLSYFKAIILGFSISFLIVSFISPNGTHQTAQMVLFVALGMLIDKNYYSIAHHKK